MLHTATSPANGAALRSAVFCGRALTALLWGTLFLVLLAEAELGQAAESKAGWEELVEQAHEQKDLVRVQEVLEQQAASNQRNGAWYTQRARLEFEQGRRYPTRSAAYKQHFTSALKYARDAISLSPTSGRAHAWYAYILGAYIELADPETQIREAAEIRRHLERGLSLGDRSADTYFALARWHYGLADLSWVSRKLAATLFSEPPRGTFQEARINFERAIEVEPRRLNLYLWLAKTRIKLDDEAGARKTLEQALQLKNPKEDAPTLAEIKKLLSSL